MQNPVILDQDPDETREWRQALDSVIYHEGPERAQYLIDQLIHYAKGKKPQNLRRLLAKPSKRLIAIPLRLKRNLTFLEIKPLSSVFAR